MVAPSPPPDEAREFSARLAALAGSEALERESLLREVYAELRRQAAALLARERHTHTLQPTALVHEAWLRLCAERSSPESRRQFLALASQAMRRILVDHARAHGAAKRGGGWERITLGATPEAGPTDELDLLALEEALGVLERESARRARVVELIWFGGCTAAEAAAVLAVSERTVGADWRYARAWLYDRLSTGSDPQ